MHGKGAWHWSSEHLAVKASFLHLLLSTGYILSRLSNTDILSSVSHMPLGTGPKLWTCVAAESPVRLACTKLWHMYVP